jgi:hypothetical protein
MLLALEYKDLQTMVYVCSEKLARPDRKPNANISGILNDILEVISLSKYITGLNTLTLYVMQCISGYLEHLISLTMSVALFPTHPGYFFRAG